MHPETAPTDADALQIARDVQGDIQRIERFGTGTSHYVYDIRGRRRAVLRLSLPSRVNSARGAVFWSERLRPLGVTLPQILHADLTMTRHPWPVLVLERLPGRDLGDELRTMSTGQQSSIASALMVVQDNVASLPHTGGFGFLSEPDTAGLPSWGHVLAEQLNRAATWLRDAPTPHRDMAGHLQARLATIQGYVDDVRPTPFLHDITTKNVIVQNGRLTGIVDVDDLCFGDPLFLVALIRMAVLAHDLPQHYADLWQSKASSTMQRRAVDIYTALFALIFLGETYQSFNRTTPSGADPAYRAKLIEIFEHHLLFC